MKSLLFDRLMCCTVHKRTKELLSGATGERFIRDLIASEGTAASNSGKTYSTANYIYFYEFPFSAPSERCDTMGRPLADFCQVDMLFIVGLGSHPAFNDDVFTVGIEIKENWDDFRRDQKMQKYISKTDYTFLAIPGCFEKDAIKKVADMDGMGVISIPSGQIVQPAKRHVVDPKINKQVYLRALFASTKSIQSRVNINPIVGESILCINSIGDAEKRITDESKDNNTLTIKAITTMNFVGNREPKVRAPRFELKNGKLSLWQGPNQPPLEYDYAEGKLIGIEVRRRRSVNGEIVYVDFHFKNGDEPFDICALASSAVAADLVGKLKNVKDYVNSTLRIDAWQNNKYTNVMLKENGRQVIYSKLPRTQKIDRGFKVEIDSSKRDQAVMLMIDDINARLKSEGEMKGE